MTSLSPQLKLSRRQRDVLLLLYRFRFLTTNHIRLLLNNKSHTFICKLLTNLSQLGLVHKYESISINLPTRYALNPKSRSYLYTSGLVRYKSDVNRVWWEQGYSDTFREKWGILADYYVNLKASDPSLRFWTKVDLRGFVGLIKPAPDAYLIHKSKRYFLELLTTTSNRVIRARVQQYITYFEEGTWQESVSTDFPTVVIICPTKSLANKLKKYLHEEIIPEPDLHFIVSSDRAAPISPTKKKA